MPIALILFALVSSFPSTSKTSWMTPQSFRLTIGMPRADAEKALRDSGWTVKKGRDDDQIVVDYSEDKALTLDFVRDRLRSIRFELFALIPDIRAAFAEQKSILKKELGNPKHVRSKSIVVYDDRLPNIMVVLSDNPNSDYGKKGFGYLAVRYYDPVVTR
ncbi:MAG TPA: hypothetical protein VF980_02420 [Thermoanaerobaculia bacterium]